jgi:hypothetical protein
MNDKFSSLPPYPKGPGSELPPSRRDWSTALWVAFAVVLASGAAALSHWVILIGLWLFGLAPDDLQWTLFGYGNYAFLLFVLLVYMCQRSDQQEK